MTSTARPSTSSSASPSRWTSSKSSSPTPSASATPPTAKSLHPPNPPNSRSSPSSFVIEYFVIRHPLHILLTNDDGIYAPGLEALTVALRRFGRVTVVAPDVEQSAAGHSITLAVPLRVREVERDGQFFGFGVSGAPADCVKLGVSALCDQRPDLVVSGINLGANVGIDVFYSGTVAAALEAAFIGIPALAASIGIGPDADLDFAAEVVCEQIEALPSSTPEPLVLNVNVPAVPRDQIKGVRLTRQCMKGYVDRYVKRMDPRGRDYFWLDGDLHFDETDHDSDVAAVREGYVSVTPLKHDLTDPETLSAMKGQEETP